MTYSLTENRLHSVLEKKAKQLRNAPLGSRRAILLGDAGCSLLRDIRWADHSGLTVSGKQIIFNFLKATDFVDFVMVFSPKRRNEYSTNAHANPRIWYVDVFDRRGETPDADRDRLFSLGDFLPRPHLDGYQARSWHQQGLCGPQARGHYLGTKLSIGQNSMSARISARALQELLAGRISTEQFREWTTGKENPFEFQLAQGRTISSLRFEGQGNEEDDDYVVFEFKEDPAATRFRAPRPRAAENGGGKS